MAPHGALWTHAVFEWYFAVLDSSQRVLITGLATCGRTAWKSLCLFLVLVLVIIIVLTRTSTRILSTWAFGAADDMIEPHGGLDHGTGHLASLRSTLRLAVVDLEALGVDQRLPKSRQTSSEVSASSLTARGGGLPIGVKRRLDYHPLDQCVIGGELLQNLLQTIGQLFLIHDLIC
jgi:hypothetical protein